MPGVYTVSTYFYYTKEIVCVFTKVCVCSYYTKVCVFILWTSCLL